jgi:CspA family cold shock protein
MLTTSYLDLLKRRGARVVVPVLCPTCFLTKGPQTKRQGEVKWFSTKKNYGFITSEEGEDVFFHERQILENRQESIQQGQVVRFHVHYPQKGPEALNVEVLDS